MKRVQLINRYYIDADDRDAVARADIKTEIHLVSTFYSELVEFGFELIAGLKLAYYCVRKPEYDEEGEEVWIVGVELDAEVAQAMIDAIIAMQGALGDWAVITKLEHTN